MAARAKRATTPANNEVENSTPPQTQKVSHRTGIVEEDFSIPFRGVTISYKSGSPIRVDLGFFNFLVENKAPVIWED